MGRPRQAAADCPAAPRPFLKWAGGKTQLLGELMQRVPEKFGTYHEPFLGAGAFFFGLKNLGRLKKARLSDINPELINVWVSLRDQVESVVSELQLFVERTSEKDFYEIRALDPGALTNPQRAARLIYLNKTGFNGLYRENRSGKFNVPYGRYARPTILDEANLRVVSRALQGVSLERTPFSVAIKHVKPGDFVYFDPPYHPLSKSSSFTAYSRGGFGEEGQRQLAATFEQLAEQGAYVLLSNSSAPLIMELYEGKGFKFETVGALRAINSKGDGRGRVTEVLVSAGGPRCKAAKASAAKQLAIDL